MTGRGARIIMPHAIYCGWNGLPLKLASFWRENTGERQLETIFVTQILASLQYFHK